MKKAFLTKSIYLVLISQFVFVTAHTQSNNLITVFDGRTAPKIAQINPGDEKLIKSEVEKRAAVLKEKNNVVCDNESFSVVDAAAGAFTKADASQKAFMYEFCRSGRSFGIGGIVIVENGKIVSHYTYGENGLYAGLKTLSDINQNGTQEIVLIGIGTGQGYTSSVIEIFEILNGRLSFLGKADVYDDNYGTDKRILQANAYKIFAQKAAAPIFTRETYLQKGENVKWVLTKKAQKFSLNKNEPPKLYKVM